MREIACAGIGPAIDKNLGQFGEFFYFIETLFNEFFVGKSEFMQRSVAIFVLAREIERNPELLLVGQPTRGVDIGAIEFIHKQLVELRDRGKAILLVSVELDEIMSLADRIIVMFDGQIMGERMSGETDETELGLLMAGVQDTGRAPPPSSPSGALRVDNPGQEA